MVPGRLGPEDAVNAFGTDARLMPQRSILLLKLTSDVVDDHLLVECARLRRSTEASAYFDAQLEALTAIGLLDDGAAAAWRRRSAETPERDPEFQPTAALRDRAQRYLESIWSDAAGPGDYFVSAVDLLSALRVISAKDGERWFDRMNEDEHADAELEAAERWPWPELGEVRRVLLGPPDEPAGFRVTSVELYDDCVLARWSVHMADGTAETSFALQGPEPIISDDLGTKYESLCIVGSTERVDSGLLGDPRPRPRWRGETTFVPAVPDDATRLVLRWEGQRFELGLVP